MCEVERFAEFIGVKNADEIVVQLMRAQQLCQRSTNFRLFEFELRASIVTSFCFVLRDQIVYILFILIMRFS